MWVANIGGNAYFTKPVMHDQVIYTASIDDDNLKTCGIHAVDASNGEKIWYFHTRNSVVNDIAYADGKILACDTENTLYAIDARTGTLEWKRRLSKDLRNMLKNGVCVQDGIVYAGQLSDLSALRVSDGKLLWRSAARMRGESSVSTPGLHQGLLHVTTAFGPRYALDAGTGKLVWSAERRANACNYSYGRALFCTGSMYYTKSRSIVEADPATGETLREVKTCHHFVSASSPVEKDGVLYVDTGDKGGAPMTLRSCSRRGPMRPIPPFSIRHLICKTRLPELPPPCRSQRIRSFSVQMTAGSTALAHQQASISGAAIWGRRFSVMC